MSPLPSSDTSLDLSRFGTRWEGIRSRWIDVRGTAVHAIEADGPVSERPHLLIHGLGGSVTNWLAVIPGLSELGPVLAVDLPGFGRTRPSHARAAHPRNQARFLAALAGAVGWERVVLHGNSMGGAIALLTAAAHPELVDRLVLASPALPVPYRQVQTVPRGTIVRFAPFLIPGLGRMAVSRIWSRLTAEQLWALTAGYVFANHRDLPADIEELSIANIALGKQHAWRQRGFVTASEGLVELLVARRPLVRAVEAVQAPTLVVRGESDNLVIGAVIDELARRRPDWAFVRLPRVGHVPMLEAPDAYVRGVQQWLET